MDTQTRDDIVFLQGLLRDYLVIALGGPDEPVNKKFRKYKTQGKEVIRRITKLLRTAERAERIDILQQEVVRLRALRTCRLCTARLPKTNLFNPASVRVGRTRERTALVKRRIIKARRLRGAGKTLQAIADDFGVSRERVRQYLKM